MDKEEGQMKKILYAVIALVLILPSAVMAHHGAVSLALGPGSPIETASPLSLPQGGFVVSTKLEYAPFREFYFAEPTNKESFTFYNLSFSYGITPFLTASVVFPYSVKKQDTLGTNSGLGDIGLNALLGFNYDPTKGFSLNKPEDTAVSLDEVRKIFFSFTGSVTFPTGRSHMELGGEIERDMQPGFRSPSFTLGISAMRQMTRNLGLVAETSYQIFTQKDNFKFGNEWRLNLAGVYELYGKRGNFLQTIDGILEFNLLNIARDKENGQKARASGGTILYVSPGVRFSFPKLQNANLGILFKFPVIKSLNEKDEQQGSEGREKYRAIVTLSFYF
jgi:hypothetical protein